MLSPPYLLIAQVAGAAPLDDPSQKFELFAIPAALLVSVLAARLRFPSRWRRGWRQLAARRGLSVFIVGVTALFACLLYAAVAGVRVPEFHDEFAYLLAGDTYAHGRLTNPPHPLWVHFESFHILQQPTYMAKFLPGQGLFLALGQVMTGYPIAGVWLSWALACAATCWMLQAWLPPRWALLGGLLTALHAGLLLQWANSYWGGAVAMLGGALWFGSFRRLLAGPPWWPRSLCLALGCSLLLLTRPVEGSVAMLPAAALLLAAALRRHWSPRRLIWQVAAPIGLVLMCTASFLAYCNLRVTGDPWRLPYQVHEETYAVAPVFFWQPARAVPEYRHEVMRRFYTGWALEQYERHHVSGNLLPYLVQKCGQLWRFALQAVLALPLVTLPWLVRNRWARFAMLDVLLVLLLVLQISWLFPHYAAPVTCLVAFLIVSGFRQMHAGSRRWPALRWLVPALIIVFIASSVIDLNEHARADPNAWNRQRAALRARLEQAGGQHLVLVRYGPRHLGYQEWVYNAALIDQAPVVWARDMGWPQNQPLLDYFEDRHIWIVDADADERQLVPYEGHGVSPGTLKPVPRQ